MSEKMYPIPFKSLMNWVVTEYAMSGEIFGVHKAQFAQRIQAAAHRRARNAGLLADLRNREQRALRRKRLDHLQPARQRSHKVRIALKRIAIARQ